MRIVYRSLAAALTLFATPVLRAQAPAAAPKPGPEHQKLAYFAGRWSESADIKPGPMGPGGKMTETSTCEWFSGGFYLVCRLLLEKKKGERSEEHTSELQSPCNIVCRLLLETKIFTKS